MPTKNVVDAVGADEKIKVWTSHVIVKVNDLVTEAT